MLIRLMRVMLLLVAWEVMREFPNYMSRISFVRRKLIGDRTSTYTIGSSLLDEIVEENGRTYHVYKDGSKS